ncbi:hypothetical protein JK358_15390 [Nocardia sp. 2]|uniref:Secreted protein n=1 Tax=Nocardia acididurans TaxID=2802282 RepID=A0ABS1M5G8_9NOCA|nr:hypothetical protein [Nocardia acididurans]MBL1075779.1 hypothetical protein [Nocardia acididurans]
MPKIESPATARNTRAPWARRLTLTLGAAATTIGATLILATSAHATPAVARPDTEFDSYCVGSQLVEGTAYSDRGPTWCPPDAVLWPAP